MSFILNTELVAQLEYMRLDGLFDGFCAEKNNPITVKTEFDGFCAEKHNPITVKTEFDGFCAEKHNAITVKTEWDGLSDVFSYEHLDLRRSKRRKTQPAERFTSYDTPNFDRDKWRRPGASSTKRDNSQRATYRDSSVEVKSSGEEVPVNITPNRVGAGAFVVKENHRSSTEGQHMSTRRTPVKEKPSSKEVKEKSTIQQRASDCHIPPTTAKNKEKNHRPTMSFQRKSFTSSRSLNGDSEPAFCRKSGRKRKERMSEREYKRMIKQCIGNIKNKEKKSA